MFLKQKEAGCMDLSVELRDPDVWKVGVLRTSDYPQNITALASEPVSGLLAVGTADGVVYVFGRPGVETKLKLPEPVGVKFLQFATLAFQLIGLDDQNMLHLWSLSSYGRPKLVISVRFDATSSLAVSPSHNHAFVALNSGEIKTYDLLCLQKSPYTMPNMWKLYEAKLSARREPPTSYPELLVEVVTHPRNLNNIFVAYGGGVVLADLAKRDTIRAYELIIPPGAPGVSGYGSPDVMIQRRPQVTALSIHPSGHFFAVGYADGSLAFWAVEDEETPILVRTLDALDINLVEPDELEHYLTLAKQNQISTRRLEREPIFKLTWSGFSNSADPRGGKTTLAILGGLNVGDPLGLTVIQLPAFNPPDPPSTNESDTHLHPFLRTEMRGSLDPLESYFYQSRGIVQDYLLIPRQTPHFSGSFDPVAIILLAEGTANTRVIQAYDFPPPGFFPGSEDPKLNTETEKDAAESLSDALASTLQALQATDEPRRLVLPQTLLNGSIGLQGGQLLRIEREIYQTLTRQEVKRDPCLPLKGGLAWSGEAEAGNLKLAKHQPHRILITHSLDLTIRFHDISAQLLIGLPPNPIQRSFPNPLDDLTVDLKPVFMDSFVARKRSLSLLDIAVIDSVHFSKRTFETVIVLKTGEIVVFRLSGPRQPCQQRELSDKELISLEHVASQHVFSPFLMFAPGLGPVEACTASDIGFVAVAYHSATFVISLQGPKIIFRRMDGKSSKGKHIIGLHPGRSETDSITSLVWTISPLAKDPQSRIRLIAMHTSGNYEIFTIVQSGPVLTCNGPISVEGGISHPIPRGSFIIDSRSGHNWTADKAQLSGSIPDVPAGIASKPGILVMTGAKGAKCVSGINGERVGKVDWGSKVGAVRAVQIVEKMGSHALVVVTDKYEVLVYSLPHLELLQNLKLPTISFSSLTLDESGDFVAWRSHPSSRTIWQATYGTLFDMRRAYELPDIDFSCTQPTVPPQPQPVPIGPSSIFQLRSWLPFNTSMTGNQLDDLLGGPDRPIPQPETQQWNYPDGTNLSAGASGLATVNTQNTLYDRLTSTLSERGQMLQDLEAQFNALEEGSKSMVAQAKRLATQQTAKSWFGL